MKLNCGGTPTSDPEGRSSPLQGGGWEGVQGCHLSTLCAICVIRGPSTPAAFDTLRVGGILTRQHPATAGKRSEARRVANGGRGYVTTTRRSREWAAHRK